MTSTTRVGFVLAGALGGGGCAGLLSIEEGTLASDTGVDLGLKDASTGDAATPDTSLDTYTVSDTATPDAPDLDGTPDTATPDTATPDTGTGPDTTVDTGTPDAGPVTPKSCAAGGDGLLNCGPDESCCTSLLVTGGTFSRSYDGVSSGYTDSSFKATVSNFRLDKYEITVGRFRQYVSAVIAGWTPVAGSGKHAHLAGGGLNGGAEAGWNVAWTTSVNFPTSKSTWDTNLSCEATYQTWTSSAGVNEKRPINCIHWYVAAAFCIWDGGFLPSEAEWNYAASGGAQQRVYPWSSPATSTTINPTLAVYYSGTGGGTQNVGSRPTGNGLYGQADLAGNVFEWTLDWIKDPYNEVSCTNCAYLTFSSDRALKGGSFNHSGNYLIASYRRGWTPPSRFAFVGARCARTP